MMRLCWTVSLGLTAATTACAQPGPPEIPIVAMPLSPAPAPVPALRYKLLPELRDTTPGNAVVLYYRAFSPEWFGFIRSDPRITVMLNMAPTWPLDKLRPDKLRDESDYDPSLLGPRGEDPRFAGSSKPSNESLIGWVRNYNMLKEVDRAARRTYCDWEMTPRVREDGIGLLLPDVQSMRSFAQMLAIRARMELADGQFDKADYTFQTGLQMGRHIGDAPTLIQALVGMAVSTVMLNQVEEWVRTPGSPNLYWALTNLPQPFVDLRKPMQGERLMLDNLMPGLREALADLKAPPMPVDKLQEMVAKLIQASGSRQPPPVLFVATLVAKKYGPAKEFLRQQGRTAEQIEAMPALQAVLMCDVAHYDRLFDEMLIVQGLPPETLLQAMVQFDRRLRDEVGRAGGPQGSVAFLLLPAVARVYSASVRLDRKINVLRCLEAIRLYAAAHGKLPDKLTDLEVPIPMDPMTGKPFDYRLDGGKAHMNATAPPGEPAHEWNTLRYEITLRR